MVEQIRIHKGLIYTVKCFDWELDDYEGEPFKDNDGNTFQFQFNGVVCGELTEGELWVKDNIKPNMISPRLKDKLFGKSYNYEDYMKKT